LKAQLAALGSHANDIKRRMNMVTIHI